MKKKKTAQPKIRLGKSKRFTGEKYTALLSSEGTSHAYLNAEIPTKDKRHIGKGGEPVAPLHTAICEVCQHAYAHLMGSGTCICRECRDDAVALYALAVQEECGINLGVFTTSSADSETERNSRKRAMRERGIAMSAADAKSFGMHKERRTP